MDENQQRSKKMSLDSGQGSSLPSTPVKPHVNVAAKCAELNVSRESGEIMDESIGEREKTEEDTDGRAITGVEKCELVHSDENNRFSHYVARSWAERMVLDSPPAPKLRRLVDCPRPDATLITDHVGANLTRMDKALIMQNNVAQDYWQLARMIGRQEIDVNFRYVFIMIGLDWCLSVKKTMIREGLKRLLYGVERNSTRRSTVGIIGVTPHYDQYTQTKFQTVTFNRCLADAARESVNRWHVEYLPLHLHYLSRNGEFLQPVSRYFNEKSELTLAGGLVLRQAILKEIGVIPMDGYH